MSSTKKVDLKVVLLGDSGVGKTCLLVRFLHNSFGNTTTTIGASFATKSVMYNNKSYSLGLWDTAGQERYDSLSSFYCRGAGCAIIAFDLTNERSFKNVEKWYNKLNTSSPDKNCFIILVGTKLDVVNEGAQKAITTEACKAMQEKIGAIGYVETSAKDGSNVQDVFDLIVKQFATQSSSENEINDQNVDIGGSNNPQQKKGCCG